MLWTYTNVEYCDSLGSMTVDGTRCAREIKSRITMEKAAFAMRKALFTSKLDIYLRKKLPMCYIWGVALYGAQNWTLQRADQKYLQSFEMWCWGRMEKISRTDRV